MFFIALGHAPPSRSLPSEWGKLHLKRWLQGERCGMYLWGGDLHGDNGIDLLRYGGGWVMPQNRTWSVRVPTTKRIQEQMYGHQWERVDQEH